MPISQLLATETGRLVVDDILAGVYQPGLQFVIPETVSAAELQPIAGMIFEEIVCAQRRQLEVSRFTAWAQRHRDRQAAGCLTTEEKAALRLAKPFFAAILDQRSDPLQVYWKSLHYSKKRRRITGRDRRRENRARKECIHYLDSARACARFDPNYRDNLMRWNTKLKHPFGARELPSEYELLEQLEADLASINEDLKDEGFSEAVQTSRSGEPCLSWRHDVSEIKDQDGCEYDLGEFELNLLANGTVIGTGGDHEREGYCHPHLASGGTMCRGDYQNFKDLLCTSGALATVFCNVNSLMDTYNHTSPYIDLRRLTNDDDDNCCCCAKCGEDVDEDESYYIHDDTYCPDCTWRCESCENSFVVGDDEEITDRKGYSYCETCAQEELHECEECGEHDKADEMTEIPDKNGDSYYYCSRCHTTCDDCGENIAKSDAVKIDGSEYCENCVRECDDCGARIATENSEHWGDAGDAEQLTLCGACYKQHEKEDEEAEEAKEAALEAAEDAAENAANQLENNDGEEHGTE